MSTRKFGGKNDDGFWKDKPLQKDHLVLSTKTAVINNKEEIKMNPSKEQIEATKTVVTLRSKAQNDIELSELLGISKNTLYTRLKLNNWKLHEISHIKTIIL